MSSSIQSNPFASDGAEPVGSPAAVNSGKKVQVTGFSSNDSISSLGGEGSAQVLLEGAPKLSAPTADTLYLFGQLQISEILTAMMRSWSDSIKEMSERIQEYYSSPQYLAEQQIHSSNEIAKEEAKKGAINPDLKIATKNASDYQDLLASSPNLQQATSRDIWEGGMNVALAVNAMLALYTQYSSLASNPNEQDRIDGVRSTSDSTIALTRSAAPDFASFESGNSLVPMLVIGAGISVPVVDAASTGQLEAKLISDAASSVISAQGSQELLQTAGWLSALWGIGLTYNTIVQDLATPGAKNRSGPQRDLEFATSFGSNLLGSLNSPHFEQQVRAIVTALIPENSPAFEDRVKQLASEAKIVLLSIALAMMMKLELKAGYQDKVFEGRVHGDEILAMLNGSLEATGSEKVQDVKNGLVSSINDLLAGLAPEERLAVLERLGSYFDTNPSVEHMLDSKSRVFDLLAETEGTTVPVNQQKT